MKRAIPVYENGSFVIYIFVSYKHTILTSSFSDVCNSVYLGCYVP